MPYWFCFVIMVAALFIQVIIACNINKKKTEITEIGLVEQTITQ